jgi:T4 bacteriophage base plate protein
MALPKLNDVSYTVKLPSTGQDIYFRPMRVREEKILLMASETDNDADQVRNLRQVIQNCIVENGISKPIDIVKLPMIDLDYLWLQIRAKSVEELVKVPFECQQPLPEGETAKDSKGNEITHCGQIVWVPINLEKIQVKKNPDYTDTLMLHEDIGVKMQLPRFETIQKLSELKEKDDYELMMEVIMDCIQMVFQGEKTYEREHMNHDELKDFLESLNASSFVKLKNYFDTLPVMSHNLHFKCPKCRHEVDMTIEGTKVFLASDSPTNP